MVLRNHLCEIYNFTPKNSIKNPLCLNLQDREGFKLFTTHYTIFITDLYFFTACGGIKSNPHKFRSRFKLGQFVSHVCGSKQIYSFPSPL